MKSRKFYTLVTCDDEYEDFCAEHAVDSHTPPNDYPCLARCSFDMRGDTFLEYFYPENVREMAWTLQDAQARLTNEAPEGEAVK